MKGLIWKIAIGTDQADKFVSDSKGEIFEIKTLIFEFRVSISFSFFLNFCKFAGQNVFEWDETLDEVNIYIDLPPKVPKNLFYAKIQSQLLEVGIKGNPPYLNVSIAQFWSLLFWFYKFRRWIIECWFDFGSQHDLTAAVKTNSSFWTIGNMIDPMPSFFFSSLKLIFYWNLSNL